MYPNILPGNADAEVCLLEAICAGPDGIKKALRLGIQADYFSSIRRQNIFKRMKEFNNANRPFNLTSIEQSFQEDQNYDAYKTVFNDFDPITTEVIGHFACIVRENGLRYKIISTTEKANREAFNQSIPITEIADTLGILVDEIDEIMDADGEDL